MAGNTIVGNGNMRALQDIVIIVDRESSRDPARICRMTGSAILGNIDRGVIWIYRLIVLVRMTIITHCGCPSKSIGMTICTFNCCMCPG